MSESSYSLSNRTIQFAKDILVFCNTIKQTPITSPMINQLVRSAMSIGANYAEANNASSKSDFRSKIFIAKKEAAETEYWLTLLEDIVRNKEVCLKLKQECHFILMTLQKIISTINNSEQKTVNGKRRG